MGRGSLLRPTFLTTAIGVCCGGAAGLGSSWFEGPVITPTNGQEVLPDLSDPGLDGRITVPLWRRPPRRLRRHLNGDPRNAYDGIGAPISLLSDQAIQVPWIADWVGHSRTIIVRPDLPLPAGQYTLRLDRSLFVRKKDHLSETYVPDFATYFTVGPDVFPPLLWETSPASRQVEVPLSAPVTLTFNESLDPSTVIIGRTVFVEDSGVDPPVPVAGVLSLRRDGFDLVFNPGESTGLPPSTRIRVRILGGGGPNSVRDRVGNALSQDLVYEFSTKDE